MGRCLGAVGGAKRVIGVDIAERRELPGERLVVLLLTLVDPAVLEQNELARSYHDAIDPVFLEWHWPSKQFAQAFGNRCERIQRSQCSLGWSAKVRGHHHRGTGLQCMLNARHGSADARVVGNGARVVLRNIEIGADEDALAREREIREFEDVHVARLVVKSRSMRCSSNHHTTWRSSTPRSCPAFDSRIPTHCHTRRRPLRACPRRLS